MRLLAGLVLAACTCGQSRPDGDVARVDRNPGDGIAQLRSGMAVCLPLVDACVTAALEDHPAAAGRLAVRVVIEDGAVVHTEVVTDRTGVPAVAACAMRTISDCSFAPGLNESITLPIAVPPVAAPAPLAPPRP
ncbi:MAG: hypothetical protein VX265_05365 [Myxococcota bacterium]|nr:hypothetical protein [Myxococcota bacterium]